MLTVHYTVGCSTHQLLLSGGCPDEVVNVLVEVHSSCTSRHPVQRAIARLGVLAICQWWKNDCRISSAV